MKKYYLIWIVCLLTLGANSQITRSITDGVWTNPGIWDNGVPDSSKRAIIGVGTTVVVDSVSEALEVVIHGVLSISEMSGISDKVLTTRWVHVNSGGTFNIGSLSNRFDQGTFSLNLTGIAVNTNQSVELANGNIITIQKNDGFLMAAGGGNLQFFGEDKLSYTKLANTSEIGETSITVENIIDRNFDGNLSASVDGIMNWEIGDEIVIASSSRDYSEEDVRIITAIQNQGTQSILTLNNPLTYRHFGEIEMYGNQVDPLSDLPIGGTRFIDLRAEVALLSRNVKIQGLSSQDTDFQFGDRTNLQVGGNNKASNGIGGHVMIMPDAGIIHVEGVQLNLMGQAGRLGRYPFHWHICRERGGDYFKNSSITNSNNRGVVVHTTDNVLVEGIVAHDIHGHCFFTEDGVELGNEFINNIAFGIHRVHKNARDNGKSFIVDDTDKFNDRGERSRTTAAFWIANAGNKYIGNITAGSEGSGYWFGQPHEPRGSSSGFIEYQNFRPRETPLDQFSYNSVHSSVTGFVIALSGDNELANGQSAGDFGHKEPVFGNINPVFDHLTVYKTEVGLYPLVSNITSIFDHFRAADNGVASHDSDPTLIRNGLMVGRSRGNPISDGPIGNRMYHGTTTIENTHIAGFSSGSFWLIWTGNRVVSGSETEKLTYEDDGSLLNMYKVSGSNFATVRDVYDRDGSLTGAFGGGAGFSMIPNNDWCKDLSLGDIQPPANDPWRWVVSENQRFASLITKNDNTITPYEFPRILVTSPHGETRQLYKAGDNGRLRFGARFDSEYLVQLPDGMDYDSNRLTLTLLQWAIPSDSIGVTLRFENQATVMKPQHLELGVDLPLKSSLADLQSSTYDAYFVDGNDLVVKIMNRSDHNWEPFVDFVEPNTNQNPIVEFQTPQNDSILNCGDDLYVSVNAFDYDGIVSGVSLYINDVLIREELIAPYEWGALNQNDLLLENMTPGTYVLRAVVEDDNGEFGEEYLTVEVLPDAPPVAVCKDTTINLDNSGIKLINADDIDLGSFDSCGQIVSRELDIFNFDCSNVGLNNVMLTVMDIDGNSSQCSSTVTVIDTIVPNTQCQDISLALDVSGFATITASDIDAGSSDACGIGGMSVDVSNFDCSMIGPNSVTLDVSDVNGNTAQCISTIIVIDTIAPIAQCQDITLALNSTGLASITASDIDAGNSDACGIGGMSVDVSNFDCSMIGPNSVTLDVSDVNGNTAQCISTIIVIDTIAPIAQCQDITLALNITGLASITASDIDAGNSDACGIGGMSVDVSSFDCSMIGPNNVTLDVSDVNGNISQCISTIIVIDTIAPNAQCQDITLALDVTGLASVTASDIDAGSSDACGIGMINVDVSSFDCSMIGTNNVTFDVSDVNGNSSQCSSTITVIDTIVPDAQCQDITLALDVTGLASITASDIDTGSSDACGIGGMNVDVSNFDCSMIGTNSVTLDVSDVNGNTSQCISTIIVIDTIAPNAQCQDITLALDVTGLASIMASDIDAGSSDACGIGGMSVDVSSFDCSMIGTNSVTLDVLDMNGNLAQCISTIIVVDTLSPIINCVPEFNLWINSNDNQVILPDFVGDGIVSINDNCQLTSGNITQTPAAGTNLMIGQYNVSICVSDLAGNMECCSINTIVENDLSVNEENLLGLNINLFPNPSENHLNIELSKQVRIKEIQIMDKLGRKVFDKTINDNCTGQVLEISELESAVYFVKIIFENGELVQQFIKK